MRTVLERLRIQFDRSELHLDSQRNAAIVFSAAMLAFTSASAGVAWRDYGNEAPFQATVRAVTESVSTRPEGGISIRWLIFDQGAFPVLGSLPQDSLADRAWHSVISLLNADDSELRALQVGDTTTLWRIGGEEFLTLDHRMPLALAGVSWVSCWMLWGAVRRQPRRRLRYLDRCLERGGVLLPQGTSEQWRTLPDGQTQVELVPSGPSRRGRDLCILGALGWIVLEFAFFCLGGLGAAALGSELLARWSLALGFMAIPFFVLAPLAAGMLPSRGSRVAWNDSTLWVNGRSFQRPSIRRVVLRLVGTSGRLQIQTAGGSVHDVSGDAIWVARILEKQGYRVGCSTRDLRSLAFSQALEKWWGRVRGRPSRNISDGDALE
jgi:hypothetical protein